MSNTTDMEKNIIAEEIIDDAEFEINDEMEEELSNGKGDDADE